jgi:hypothetical protein
MSGEDASADDAAADAEQRGHRRKASIDVVDESAAQSFTVTSPRSLTALRNCSLGAEQLQYKPLEDFLDADIPPRVARLNHELFEKRRRERLACVKDEYLAVCRWAETPNGDLQLLPADHIVACDSRAEYDANVELVLSDLSNGLAKYILDRSDIYHPEVAVELKHSVVLCGRHYKVGHTYI